MPSLVRSSRLSWHAASHRAMPAERNNDLHGVAVQEEDSGERNDLIELDIETPWLVSALPVRHEGKERRDGKFRPLEDNRLRHDKA